MSADIKPGQDIQASSETTQKVVETSVPRNRNRWNLLAAIVRHPARAYLIAIFIPTIAVLSYSIDSAVITALQSNALEFGDPYLKGTLTGAIFSGAASTGLTISSLGYLGWRAVNHFRQNR